MNNQSEAAEPMEPMEAMEAMKQAAIIPEAPAAPQQKTAKERKREEKERIQHYRMEKRMERIAEKNGRPIRRIGTFTMGIALIIAGCVILYWLVNPTMIPGFLAYFGPAILIMLGCEILYNYFRYQGARFQYDILSAIICFFLICGCAGISVLPIAYEYFGPERHITESRLEQNIYDLCYEKLQNRNDIAGLDINVYLEGITYEKTMTVSDIAPSDYVDIRIHMKDRYHSKEEFAAACKSVVDIVNEAGLPYRYIHFATEGDGSYSLSFYQDKFSQRRSLEELVQQVAVEGMEDAD